MTINNFENHGVDRGVELMLRRRKEKDQPKLDVQKFNFFKLFSFLKRDFQIKIELSVKKK
jgi:hypothetical protein